MAMMRAVRYWGNRDIRVESMPIASCGDGEVRIAPSFCGICGTDLHEYLHGPNVHPSTPHPLTGESNPIVLGHEFSGVVTELGKKGVTKLKVGDRVAVKGTLSCGECEPCRVGWENACVKSGNLGQSGRGGGLADSVIAKEDWCFVLPDHIGLDIGALIEPLAVAQHAISLASINPTSHALILGAGPIGLALTLLLKAHGLTTIIVSEPSPQRRTHATTFGASHVLDPSNTKIDIKASITKLTDNAGPHAIFDCAGVAASLETACSTIRIHGTVVNLALFTQKVSFDPNLLLFREATYRASLSHRPDDWKVVLGLIGEGRLKVRDLERMVTGKIGMERVVEDGLEVLGRDLGMVKILVVVNGEGGK